MALITTTHGLIEESSLLKTEGELDNDNEYTTWVEYRIGDEVVHRSAHVTLKRWPHGLGAILGGFK